MTDSLADAQLALRNPDQKRDYNRNLFREVAPRYDLITRILSFGRDASWKRWLIRQLPDQPDRASILDIACGTGDITRALAARYPNAGVCGLDLSPEMLSLARNPSPDRIRFVPGDMTHTECADASIDILTGGYALRNAPDLDAALHEIHRVLRPEGTAAFLDFSAASTPALRHIHYGLLWFWGSLWGLILHGNPRVYAYIARSLATFPDRSSLHRQLKEHDLHPRTSKRFMFGMIEVIVCQKPKTGAE